MIKKPEKISIFIFAISAMFLALSIANCISLEAADLGDIVLPALSISLLLVIAELLIHKLSRFIVVTLLHIIVLFPVILRVGFRYPFIGVMLACTLILNISFRFSIKISIPLNMAIVLVPAVITVINGRQVLEVAAPSIIEIAVICFCGIVVFYREALVTHDQRLEAAHRSLENFSAASDSLIRQLPEMKEESAEKERLRITRELHDSLGYSMTNIAMIMNAAQYLFEESPEKVKDYCLKAKEMALNTMEETRQTLYKLRAIGRITPRQPAIFFGRMCRDFQEATGIETECHPGNLTKALPERVFQALLRTVQVGFINAMKHGKANRIRLFFWVSSDGLTMTIWNSVETFDFDMSQITEGIGLKGVRERIDVLEGELHMDRSPDAFSLTVAIPARELRDSNHHT